MTAILDRVVVAADAGRVTDGKPADPDPEVPGRARRRTFTAKYKLGGHSRTSLRGPQNTVRQPASPTPPTFLPKPDEHNLCSASRAG